MVLHLMDRHVHLPLTDIPVSPFGTDRQFARWMVFEPFRQELLGQPIGAGDVDVTHPDGGGEVEHLAGALPHGLLGAIRPEVTAAVGGYVGGSAQRRQPQPDRGDREPGRSQRSPLHGGESST